METLTTDVLVLGGGGAAARAALEAASHDLHVVIVSKGPFSRSCCTVMAEGGYNAVIRTKDPEDSFELHYKDTVEGGAYLNDRDLVEILVTEAPDRLVELENMGAVFTRGEDGYPDQRPFGGQSKPRTCYAGDRTGHEIMTTLSHAVRSEDNITVFENVIALDLVEREGRVIGALCLDLVHEEPLAVSAKITVLATGGAGHVYPVTTNPVHKTGDGYAMALRVGQCLIDMEMVQFHPTGMVYPESARGILVTEAVRGEGGRLYNVKGERFMKKYDPERMELSTRDVVARAIYREIQEGRGTEHDGVYLDVSHLPDEIIETKLETTLKQFLRYGVDVRKEPMEVAPTAHHFMGGVPIDTRCRTDTPGLLACGEVTGGVHGANRLGGNALADTQVFGKRAGETAAEIASKAAEPPRLRMEDVEDLWDRWTHTLDGEEDPLEIRDELHEVMWNEVGVERNGKGLRDALRRIRELRERVEGNGLSPTPDLRTAAETVNMLTVAEAVATSALHRTESRGAHYRTDHPESWEEPKHTVYHPDGTVNTIPVRRRKRRRT